MTRLGDLIDAASRANNGRSMTAAAELATQRGAPISKSHISKNARNIDTLTPQLIWGVALGYDIPPEDVARAALEDLGVVIPDHQTSPESAIRRDPTLSSEAKAMLLAAIGAARSSPPMPAKGKRHVDKSTTASDPAPPARVSVQGPPEVEEEEGASPDESEAGALDARFDRWMLEARQVDDRDDGTNQGG